MPRDSGTGVATPPPNTNAISNQPIESAKFNSLVGDVYAILNTLWPIGLGGTGASSLGGLLTSIGGVAKSGDTMTGPLTLNADPSNALHSSTKQYVDAQILTRAPTAHTQLAATITDFPTAADARISAATIGALSDVAVTSPINGHVIQHNGTEFVNRLPFTEYTLTAIDNGVEFTQAHGLARIPTRVEWYGKCVVANLGYAVGDMIPFRSFCETPYFGVESADATNAKLKTRSAITFYLLNPTTFVQQAITNASWVVVVRVFP